MMRVSRYKNTYILLRVRGTVVVYKAEKKRPVGCLWGTDKMAAYPSPQVWACFLASSFEPQKKPTRVAAGMRVHVSDAVCIIYEMFTLHKIFRSDVEIIFSKLWQK